jgi:phospholipase C
VPTIVISPYTIAHNVYHKTLDFSDIVQYIEQTFSLPHQAMYNRAGTVGNLAQMLNYTQKPLSPVILPAKTCPAATTSHTPKGYIPNGW